jgi:(2R)-sulfolactate sulfo-lyase subunit alpha
MPALPQVNPGDLAMTIHFVVHEDGDSVGTVVVENVKSGATLTGWVMEQDKTVSVKVLDDIPIGHKVALKDLKNGDTVIKYGVDIGRTIAPIKQGEYLHVHNVKTKRW